MNWSHSIGMAHFSFSLWSDFFLLFCCNLRTPYRPLAACTHYHFSFSLFFPFSESTLSRIIHHHNKISHQPIQCPTPILLLMLKLECLFHCFCIDKLVFFAISVKVAKFMSLLRRCQRLFKLSFLLDPKIILILLLFPCLCMTLSQSRYFLSSRIL